MTFLKHMGWAYLALALSGCANQVYVGHLNNNHLTHSIPLRRVMVDVPYQTMDVVVVRGNFPRSEPALSATGYFSAAWQAQFRQMVEPALARHGIQGQVVFVDRPGDVRPATHAAHVLVFQPQALTLMPDGSWYFIHHEVQLRPASSRHAIYTGYIHLYPYLHRDQMPQALSDREGEVRPVFEDLAQRGLIPPLS